LHIGSKEVISRYEFAVMIANVFGFDSKLLIPVKNREVPGWVAPRPVKGGLKVTLAEKSKIPIYRILDGLKDYRDKV
jgi:dTDP-4-dehydrorhamnose reductase